MIIFFTLLLQLIYINSRLNAFLTNTSIFLLIINNEIINVKQKSIFMRWKIASAIDMVSLCINEAMMEMKAVYELDERVDDGLPVSDLPLASPISCVWWITWTRHRLIYHLVLFPQVGAHATAYILHNEL